jgi:uncharacterized SAM-binding protein YcdF (DUF218 family)
MFIIRIIGLVFAWFLICVMSIALGFLLYVIVTTSKFLYEFSFLGDRTAEWIILSYQNQPISVWVMTGLLCLGVACFTIVNIENDNRKG